ncbi:hypothetical protein ACGF13_22690 [Kitasatospora sp. NPDC048286]|uniref:hypothetical protein n=1 Tax=Kitasatospora sp. NPDC048286 TaxID=3364047 RepID=UPI0037140DF9
MTAPQTAGHPLVREVFPDLVGELVDLLTREGEPELAARAWSLRLVAECRCGDDFCQSFRTDPHPDGRPYGRGHRCVPLDPAEGMLVLDVVDGRIVYVEVLDREPLRDTRPGPGRGPGQD